jgi:anti-anti-sigma regulatory factor
MTGGSGVSRASRGSEASGAGRSRGNEQGGAVAEHRRAILELQTPVIQVWDGILALPIVGALDTARSQEMTEALLQRIVDTGSDVVILDITGVPIIDTAVAKHLLETVAAARLLGAEVLIVGLTTRTAMTLVHLGVDLSSVTTRTTMAKGLELAFARLGLEVTRRRGGALRGNVGEAVMHAQDGGEASTRGTGGGAGAAGA